MKVKDINDRDVKVLNYLLSNGTDYCVDDCSDCILRDIDEVPYGQDTINPCPTSAKRILKAHQDYLVESILLAEPECKIKDSVSKRGLDPFSYE